jgi:hypothetical protein
MNNQTIGGTETRTRRTEHVQIGGLFGVESMQGGGSTKANGHGGSTYKVETA